MLPNNEIDIMTTTPLSMSLQTTLQTIVNTPDFEATALIGCVSVHTNAVELVPIWENESNDDELQMMTVQLTATFADNVSSESIGAFATKKAE